jgi:hypothetical protein
MTSNLLSELGYRRRYQLFLLLANIPRKREMRAQGVGMAGDQEFKVIYSYKASLRPAWSTK